MQSGLSGQNDDLCANQPINLCAVVNSAYCFKIKYALDLISQSIGRGLLNNLTANSLHAYACPYMQAVVYRLSHVAWLLVSLAHLLRGAEKCTEIYETQAYMHLHDGLYLDDVTHLLTISHLGLLELSQKTKAATRITSARPLAYMNRAVIVPSSQAEADAANTMQTARRD